MDDVTSYATAIDRKLTLPNLPKMSGQQFARTLSKLRSWRQLGNITHAQLSIANAMLLTLRKHGQRVIRPSYTQIEIAANASRGTVAAALRRLEELGLFIRTKVRIRVPDWHNGGITSRQGMNVYVFQVAEDRASDTESNDRTVPFGREIIIDVAAPRHREVAAAQASLALIRNAREEQLRNAWLARSSRR